MLHCFKCYGDMVEVSIIDKRENKHKAVVCTVCGRIASKDRLFKKEGNYGLRETI